MRHNAAETLPALPHRGAEFFGRLAHNIIAEPPEFEQYFKEAWPIIEPARPLIFGWHIGCILDHLTAVELMQIRNLLITMPPRHTKSITVSVIWPTWSWTTSPWLRYLASSYASGLSIKHNVDRRDLIRSSWYQRNWGDVVRLKDDQDQKQMFSNTARGHMIAMGIGGTVTGFGGDRLLIDDLINPDMAESKADRDAAIRFYDNTLCTRLDDKEHGSKVAVMQRTHRKDLAGHIIASELGNGDWVHLNLPAEAPKKVVVVYPVSRAEVVRKAGDILCPERESRAEHVKTKARNVRVWNAQYQQDPSHDDSDFFNRNNWQYYDELPVVKRSAWGWDTAEKEKKQNDASAGFHISECANGYYISRRRYLERVRYSTLKNDFKNEVLAQPADVVVVEDASSGTQLCQDMQEETAIPVIALQADKDKVFKASLISPVQQARKIFLPRGATWVPAFVEMCQNFPDVDFDDEMDAFTAAMLYLTGKLKGGSPGLTVSDNGNGHVREDGEIVETDLTPELIQQRLREAAGVTLNGGNGNGHD